MSCSSTVALDVAALRGKVRPEVGQHLAQARFC
jgi:hypothetical protein